MRPLLGIALKASIKRASIAVYAVSLFCSLTSQLYGFLSFENKENLGWLTRLHIVTQSHLHHGSNLAQQGLCITVALPLPVQCTLYSWLKHLEETYLLCNLGIIILYGSMVKTTPIQYFWKWPSFDTLTMIELSTPSFVMRSGS